MIEERARRLLDALEERTDTLLGLLQEERRQRRALTGRLAELERHLAELEANRLALEEERLALEEARRELVEQHRELVEECRELDEQNRELEEHNRHLHERLAGNADQAGFPRPHRRSQGLSALIGRPAQERDAPASAPVEARFIGGPTVRRSDPIASEVDTTEAPMGAHLIGQDETPTSSSTTSSQGRLAIAEPPSPQALLAEWYQRYGSAFFKGHTRPLQVGIHEALAACEPWPEKLVRRALACYVNLPRYLTAVREGAERIDLSGQPAGVVDAQAAEIQAERDRLAEEIGEREQVLDRAEQRLSARMDAINEQARRSTGNKWK